MRLLLLGSVVFVDFMNQLDVVFYKMLRVPLHVFICYLLLNFISFMALQLLGNDLWSYRLKLLHLEGGLLVRDSLRGFFLFFLMVVFKVLEHLFIDHLEVLCLLMHPLLLFENPVFGLGTGVEDIKLGLMRF